MDPSVCGTSLLPQDFPGFLSLSVVLTLNCAPRPSSCLPDALVTGSAGATGAQVREGLHVSVNEPLSPGPILYPFALCGYSENRSHQSRLLRLTLTCALPCLNAQNCALSKNCPCPQLRAPLQVWRAPSLLASSGHRSNRAFQYYQHFDPLGCYTRAHMNTCAHTCKTQHAVHAHSAWIHTCLHAHTLACAHTHEHVHTYVISTFTFCNPTYPLAPPFLCSPTQLSPVPSPHSFLNPFQRGFSSIL